MMVRSGRDVADPGPAADVLDRVPGPRVVRLITTVWLAILVGVRLSVLAGGDKGLTFAPTALLLSAFAVQAPFAWAGERFWNSRSRWVPLAGQALLTYLPFLLFGSDWIEGNSGLLVGALLLTAGRVVGPITVAAVAAADLALTATVLHETQAFQLSYAVVATVDNGVLFWGLVRLTRIADRLHAERAELARLAMADERSRAERALRTAFGERLLSVERHVRGALRQLPESAAGARAEVAAALTAARECQASLRSIAEDEPLAVRTRVPPPPTRRGGAPLTAMTALTVLELNLCVQAVFDAVDGLFAAVSVTGMAAAVLAALVVLSRSELRHSAGDTRVEALFPVVTCVMAAFYVGTLITVAVVMPHQIGMWIGAGCFALGAPMLLARANPAWWLRVFPATFLGAGVLSALVTPDGGRFADSLYIIAVSLIFGLSTAALVQFARFAVALTRTRRHVARLAALRERVRVARDVHDLLGLGVSTLVVKGELALRLLDADPDRAARELDELGRLAARAAATATAVVGAGARPSLREELRTAEQTLAGVGIDVAVHAPEPALTGEADRVLAVVLRESVTNILRHSTAEQVGISFGVRDGRATLTVENDGLPARTQTAAMGNGLRNMSARITEAGGVLTTAAAHGRFRLDVELAM